MPSVRTLFVDDEPAILALFRTILEMQGYTVQCAASASEACAVLACQPFDLVVTDMHMENPLAGLAVVRAARRQKPRPVVAILTAYVLGDHEWRPSGADELFVKGTEVAVITRRLRELLHRPAAAVAS